MKRLVLLTIAFSFLFAFVAKAQYGFGTASPNQSAIVDMTSTSKGVLIPRVALTGTSDATTIANGNVTSLLVYNTATVSDVTPGFYYWNGTVWVRIVESSTGISFDLITGGTNTSAAMVVGTGASLAPTGSGTVTANIFAAGTGTTNAVDLNSDEVAGNLPIGNIAPGSNNYVLTTNASGATAWALITNDNVSTSAAIAGTKISPDFGSQDVTTSGNISTTGTGTLTVGGTSQFNGDVSIGDNTNFDNPSANEDLYVEGNLEVDGTIYGTFSGSMSGQLEDGNGIADFTYDGSSNQTVSIDYTYAGTWTGTQTFDVASGNAAVFADAIDVQGDIANSGGDVTINDNLAVSGGTFALASGTTVNEIVTSIGATPTDDQLPTAKAVDDAIDASQTTIFGEPFITFQTSTNLTNERVITAGSGIDITMVTGNDGSATIAVDYDDTTIGINGTTSELEVKDDGITTAKIADDNVTAAKINSDVAGAGIIQETSGALATQTAQITTVNADYTATVTDGTILVNASSGNVTITLPGSATTGMKITIKKIDNSSNTVSVGTVDGTTKTWNVQWQGYIVQYDGTNWYVVGIF